MTFFPKTQQILTEGSFLAFISKVNEDFIAADKDEYEFYLANQYTYSLSLKTWLTKCQNQEERRFSNGGLATFKVFALDKIIELFYEDWNAYHARENTRSNKAFLHELNIIYTLINEAKHLEPVRHNLIETLKRNLDQVKIVLSSPGENTPAGFSEALVWNGQSNVLCTLFYDLITKKPRGGKKVYLDYLPEQMEEWLLLNFRLPTQPLARDTVHTCFSKTRDDKRAKDSKRLFIPEDVE